MGGWSCCILRASNSWGSRGNTRFDKKRGHTELIQQRNSLLFLSSTTPNNPHLPHCPLLSPSPAVHLPPSGTLSSPVGLMGKHGLAGKADTSPAAAYSSGHQKNSQNVWPATAKAPGLTAGHSRLVAMLLSWVCTRWRLLGHCWMEFFCGGLGVGLAVLHLAHGGQTHESAVSIGSGSEWGSHSE